MNYYILKRVTDQGGTYYTSVPVNAVYTTMESAKDAARKYVANHQVKSVYLVQEFAKVAVEPVITMTEAPPPEPVYRAAAVPVPEAEDTTPRQPQTKPRLLIVPDRRATPAEIFGHLMVVAEGQIVKNAFGALELADMPLVGDEVATVTNALSRSR